VFPNSATRPGELSTIHVKTDSRTQPEIRIPIVTDGVAGIRLIPDSIDFGALVEESLPARQLATLTVNSNRELPFGQFHCRVDDARFQAHVLNTSEAKSSVVIQVELLRGSAPGDYWTDLDVIAPDGQVLGSFPVHAQVLGRYHAKPGTIILDAGRAEDCTEGRVVTVSRRSDGTSAALSIAEVVVPPALQSAVVASCVGPNRFVMKSVRRQGPAPFQSRIRAAIRVRIQDPDLGDSFVTVPVSVTVRPQDAS